MPLVLAFELLLVVPELKAFFPWSFFISSSLLHNLSLI
jgi:hypothetical protein